MDHESGSACRYHQSKRIVDGKPAASGDLHFDDDLFKIDRHVQPRSSFGIASFRNAPCGGSSPAGDGFGVICLSSGWCVNSADLESHELHPAAAGADIDDSKSVSR